MIYFASPICFINDWLSQKRFSAIIFPFFQCPTVHMGSLNVLPVGAMVLPLPIGIGLENVPRVYPVTHVQSPEPNFIGCSTILVSGAKTNIGFNSSMCVLMSVV